MTPTMLAPLTLSAATDSAADTIGQDESHLSYKFQRLRERVRQAIVGGEFAGKLPGERQLAKRFRVNAKTLSKALTDLAAEGLLDRSIGRGTFVKGFAPAATAAAKSVAERWLILADAERADSPLARALVAAVAGSQILSDPAPQRPSFLNNFTAVLDLASQTPDAVLRDLVVRGVPVVLIDREPAGVSMHAVVVDRTLGASKLARELMIAGHTKLMAVERPAAVGVAEFAPVTAALRAAAARYAPTATVETGRPNDVAAAACERGVTAVVCDSLPDAAMLIQTLGQLSIAVPRAVSVVAVDACADDADPACSGYFVPVAQMLEAVRVLLTDAPKRPTTLWLVGRNHNATTTGCVAEMDAVIGSITG